MNSTNETHIPFVVRADESTSDIIFQTSDTTWQAYNGRGGANLYGVTAQVATLTWQGLDHQPIAGASDHERYDGEWEGKQKLQLHHHCNQQSDEC